MKSLLWSFVIGILLQPCVGVAESLPVERFKDGTVVRSAFEEVVSDPSSWTVRVLENDRQIALGAILESDGHILTKASQLEGTLVCELKDGRKFDAEIVGINQAYDLALLKITATDLPVLEWAKGSTPEVGRWLATPGLSKRPVAIGVVSVGPRRIPPVRGFLGVGFEDAPNGASLTSLMPRGAAESVGLQIGDIIRRVSGVSIPSGAEFRDHIRNHLPGDQIVLRIFRHNQEFDIEVRLQNPSTARRSRSNFQNTMGGQISLRRSGFSSVLQHDTVLRPTDCGGPVVNLDGKAVGINIARAGRTETFALPADLIQPLVAELKSGRFSPPKLELFPTEEILAELQATIENSRPKILPAKRRTGTSKELFKNFDFNQPAEAAPLFEKQLENLPLVAP